MVWIYCQQCAGIDCPGIYEETVFVEKWPLAGSGDVCIAELFAGASGLTEGFRRAGITPVAAVEHDKWAARTYAANFGQHVIACPIENVDVRRVGGMLVWSGFDINGNPLAFETPEVAVLIGGPPCQGFSPLSRMNDWTFEDTRNALWKHYVRILKIIRPAYFLIENVPQFLKSVEYPHLLRRVHRLGYSDTEGILNASDFGVPQSRRRAIIIGALTSQVALPQRLKSRPKTVGDAISDLPIHPTGENWHFARNPTDRSIERYKLIPPGGNRFDLVRRRPDLAPKCWLKKKVGSTDVFGRMHWSEPAPTIRTEFYKPEKGRYLHPQADRPITIREAARLQTFDDAFIFCGSNVQVAKQIGNAVPVKLATVLAKILLSAHSGQKVVKQQNANSSMRSPASYSTHGSGKA